MSENDDITIELGGCLIVLLCAFFAVLGFALGWFFGGLFL